MTSFPMGGLKKNGGTLQIVFHTNMSLYVLVMWHDEEQ